MLTSPAESNLFLPIVFGQSPARLLLSAAYVDSSLSGEPDEAFQLWNIGGAAQPLAGWQVASNSKLVAFAGGSTLQLKPGEFLWCTAQALAFRTTFAADPVCEWAIDSDPAIENLEGKFTFNNAGGAIRLLDNTGKLIDTLVYGDETQTFDGWTGLPAQLYTRGVMPTSGQLWQRKVDPQSGWLIDHNQPTDWAGDLADLRWGRRVRMPGWGGWATDDRWPLQGSSVASFTVAIGPEGLYQPISSALSSAQQTLDLSIYTLEHPELAQNLAAAAQRGVKVRIILEGSPPGGISDLQKWCVALVAGAGVDVRYLAVRDDAPRGYPTRYRYTHAKYIVVDGRLALLGTDNFNYDSMPLPVAENVVVGGRRGFYLITDAQGVINSLQQIFIVDWRPERFLDLRPFEASHPRFGRPPEGFVFPPMPQYPSPDNPYRQPVSVQGNARWQIISSPENSLRPDAGLFALIERAGDGDEIVLVQLYEHKNWGESTSSPVADPNPRLQALIEAARRGATVRLLLDSYFDAPVDLRSNRATADYVRSVAAAEGLKLEARVGNPTGGGIHAKLLLLRVGGEKWSVVGSLNGGEISHKLNREVSLATDLAGIYDRLHTVFDHDWALEN